MQPFSLQHMYLFSTLQIVTSAIKIEFFTDETCSGNPADTWGGTPDFGCQKPSQEFKAVKVSSYGESDDNMYAAFYWKDTCYIEDSYRGSDWGGDCVSLKGDDGKYDMKSFNIIDMTEEMKKLNS